MKREIKILLISLCAALLLSGSALAESYGLGVFANVRTMDSTTFRDVDSLAWYFGGVCRAYDKGIMEGTAPRTFDPKGNVTWSQAVTIAARIHSRYNGVTLNTVPAAGESWYAPYLAYAKAAGLLPSTCPQGAAVNTTAIDRSSIAYLLNKCISAADLPRISDKTVPDIASVGEEFQPAVNMMYSSGVLTGMDNNMFNGEALTTRAQMATIITRLLMPSQRIGSDGMVNLEMADVEGSLENDCVAVKVGNYYYCAYKYYPRNSSGTAGKQVFALYRTDGNDNALELYTCPAGAKLSDVSSYLGKVYFSVTYPGSNKGALMCYDPAKGETSQIFTQYAVRSYCWYNNRLYVLAFTNYGYDATGKKDYIENDRYTFGTVVSGRFVQLAGPYTFYQVMQFQPYGYMGKIYFNVSSYSGPTNLYAMDISTGTVSKLCDKNINASYFDGHVMYFLSYNLDSSYDTKLYALSLAKPDFVDTLGTFPDTSANSYRTLYGREGYTYCMTGDTGKLYRMDASGKSRIVVDAAGEYNSVTFAGDKIILTPNSFITSNPNEMKAYNLSSYSARALYPDWIGCSCWYRGARFMADKGVSVYSSTTSVSTIKNLEIQVTEAYFAGNDFIVRAKYINNSGQKISALRMQYLDVYVNGKLAAATVNDFVSMDLVKDDIQTFTFVIGRQDQTPDFDLSRGKVMVEITPTFEYAVNTYSINSTAAVNGGYSVSVNGALLKAENANTRVRASAGDAITIGTVPAAGYAVSKVTVTGDSTGKAVTVTQNKNQFSFTMPAEPVTISVTFTKAA